MRTGLLIPMVVALAACQPSDTASVDHPWVRLAAVPGNPSAAYFTLHGGTQDETLTAVAAPQAVRAEMHESMAKDGMTAMTPLKLVALRAGDTVEFRPGGKHVMLYGLNPTVPASGATPLTFAFASGRSVTVSAKVIGAGDPAPQ